MQTKTVVMMIFVTMNTISVKIRLTMSKAEAVPSTSHHTVVAAALQTG